MDVEAGPTSEASVTEELPLASALRPEAIGDGASANGAAPAMAPGVEASGASPLPRGVVAGARSTTPAAWEALAQQAVEQARREETWKAVTRGALVLVAVVLAFRLVFDEVLPRLLLALTVGATAVVVAAMVAQALGEARRQRVLLLALAQLTRAARSDPGLREKLAGQIDGLVSALRVPSRVWPWAEGETQGLLSVLARHGTGERTDRGDGPG